MLFSNTKTETETETKQDTSTGSGVFSISEKLFQMIRQGRSTNALTKIRATEGRNANIDKVTGDATIKQDTLSLKISNYKGTAGLKTSAYQLLDAIIIALTKSGAKSPTVILSLKDYMSQRGLKDRKEAKTQAKADIETLRGISLSWEEKRGKKVETYKFINLADSGEIKRNGDIVFTFGNTFYNILLSYPVMPYPSQLQKLNSKRNPHSFYLLRKIAEHKNMNIGKKNEDIISVKTLLENAPYIPSYKEVMSGNRNIEDRIINPFERDMNALADTLKWEYCNSLNAPLTDTELQSKSYEVFEGFFIHTIWNDYPNQTARLERKAKRIEEAKKKNRTTSKKEKHTEE